MKLSKNPESQTTDSIVHISAHSTKSGLKLIDQL